MLRTIILTLLFLIPVTASAGETKSFTIVIRDHRFEPVELTVPTGEKFKLIVDNQDPSPEEFESYDLNREKVVGGKKKITVYLGPLQPGLYKYFGEFHQETAQGLIKAIEQ